MRYCLIVQFCTFGCKYLSAKIKSPFLRILGVAVLPGLCKLSLFQTRTRLFTFHNLDLKSCMHHIFFTGFSIKISLLQPSYMYLRNSNFIQLQFLQKIKQSINKKEENSLQFCNRFHTKLTEKNAIKSGVTSRNFLKMSVEVLTAQHIIFFYMVDFPQFEKNSGISLLLGGGYSKDMYPVPPFSGYGF